MLIFAKLLGFKNWIIGGLILAAFLYVWHLRATVESLGVEIKKEKAMVEMMKSENDALIVKVKNWAEAYQRLNELAQKCSNAVDHMEKTQQIIQNKAAEAIKKAKDDTQAIQGQINLIAMRGANPEGNCSESLSQVRSDLKGMQ